MGKAFQPGVINTPRNDVTNLFSGLLRGGIAGTTDVGSRLAGGFSLPKYSGPFTAQPTGLQTQGADAISGALKNYDPGFGQDVLAEFANMFGGGRDQSGAITTRLDNNPGSGTLASAAGGGLDLQRIIQSIGSSQPAGFGTATTSLANNPAISQLLQLGSGGSTSANPALAALLGFRSSLPGVDALQNFTPNISERFGLNNVAGQDVIGQALSPLHQAQGLLSSYSSLPAVQSLLNGGGGDIGQIYQALDAQRRQSLGTDIRDLREQFSGQGLRYGTDLANAITTRQGQSEQNLNATVAQLIPQLLGSQTQSRSAGLNFLAQIPQLLTSVGGTTGNLGLGQQQNTISGLGTAGQLGLGASGQSLSGMQSAIQSILSGQGLNLDALKAASATGSSDLSSIVQALSSAGSLQQGGASSLASLLLQGQGQQAGILQSLLGTQVGAAGTAGQQSLSGTDILSQFLTGQSGQQLQALLSSPSALQTITSILPSLGAQAFGVGQQQYANADTGVARQIQSYQDSLSMIPQIISFLSGTPAPTMTKSPVAQGIDMGTQILNSAAGLKAAK